VPLTEDDEMVETFVADRLDPAFDVHLLIGSLRRNRYYSGASIFQHCVELSDVLPVPVTSDVLDAEPFAASMLQGET